MSSPAPLTADYRYLSEHERGTECFPDGFVPVEDYEADVGVPMWARARVMAWPEEHSVTLDRLSFCGDLRADELADWAHWLGTSPVWGDQRDAQMPYRWQRQALGMSGLLQYSDGLRSAVRVRFDCNPEHCDASVIREVAGWLENLHVTRVDVALDYPENLSGCLFDRPRASRQSHHGADGQLETVYLGAPGSKLRYRCYDKGRERVFAGQSAVTVDGAAWWRLEAVWRPVGPDTVLPETLFDSLGVDRFAPNVCGSWKDVGALLYARDHPEWIRRLHWRQRRAVSEGLECVCSALDPAPVALYMASRERLLAEIVYLTGLVMQKAS